MIGRKVTIETLQSAASEVGVELNETQRQGRGWKFTLRPDRMTQEPDEDNPRRMLARYQRRSASYGERKVHAVCWHGHRDFFRAVYRREPEAVFVTAIARYEGTEGFEETFPETAYRNIGSQMYPCTMAEACYCDANS